MMKQIQALLYFFIVDSKRTVTIFCSILLLSITILTALAAITDVMYITITAPAYIFMIIFGFRTIQDSLPFAIKRGVTRKSYHIAVGIYILLNSFVMITFLTAVQLLFNAVYQVANITNINIIRPISASTELKGIFYSLPLDFALLLSFFATGLLLGIITYKYGFLGGAILGGLVLIGMTVTLASRERLIDLLTWIQDLSVLPAFGLLSTIAILCYMISWIFIRTSSTQHTA